MSRKTSFRWARERGGVAPKPSKASGSPGSSNRYLSMAEREEIAIGLERGDLPAQIARRLGRHRSTIIREIARNRPAPAAPRARPKPYRAVLAQAKAEARARRPKVPKLVANPALRREVKAGLRKRWSPTQIACRLRADFPDSDQDGQDGQDGQGGRMRISHEAIYQSLYVQGRGELRRDLTRCLRTGRTMRKPQRRGAAGGRGKIPNMIMISDRPAEAEDRAVPGHWEGDLIIGKNCASAIGTLVERTTRYTMLLHLPGDRGAEAVRDAMITAIGTLPKHLWRSLTWDQGSEMSKHHEITIATGIPIYFCDPHSPWQRGSNENTNGLLRQYFPKSTDLSIHTRQHLDAVAVELNGRPRQTLNWRTPAEALNQLLSHPFNPPGVATTG